MRVREAIIRATQKLRNNNIDEPEFEAISLVAHALKLNKASLYLNYEKVVSDSEFQAVSQFLDRRLNHEPLEYLTNLVNFMGIEFIVEPPVFIPRPETEVLVEILVKLALNKSRQVGIVYNPKGKPRKMRGYKGWYPVVYDIGTGCGVIGISALKFLPHAKVYASDIIDLRLAQRNAVKNGVSDRITFLRGNLLAPFRICAIAGSDGSGHSLRGRFADFIVSNPPYIPTFLISELQPEIRFFESNSSINGKEDGLFFIRELIKTAGLHLKQSGALLLEISPEQENKVRQEAMGYFKSVNFVKDYSGKTRVLVAKDILTK